MDFTGAATETIAGPARPENAPEAVQEREVTTLAAGLREFSALSRRPAAGATAAGATAELLERALAPLVDLVISSHGTLDQFRGETLLAFWNAPRPVADHPAAAVAAALALRGARAEGAALGLGLHTGPAWIGRMGPAPLARYTIIGEAVNLSFRLESLGRLYGVETVVSGATRQACGEAFAFQTLDLLQLPELDQPLVVFAPLAPDEARARAGELERQAEALVLYREGEFQKAGLFFQDLAARRPGFGLYEIFTRRCAKLSQTPPAEWVGVWSLVQSRALEVE
jgi:adenylate cyclase